MKKSMTQDGSLSYMQLERYEPSQEMPERRLLLDRRPGIAAPGEAQRAFGILEELMPILACAESIRKRRWTVRQDQVVWTGTDFEHQHVEMAHSEI